MGRLTKLLVIVSTLGAALLELHSASATVPRFPLFAAIVAAIGYVVSRRAGPRSAGIVMACGYLLPAVLFRLFGYGLDLLSIWTIALLAAAWPAASIDWQVPPRFRFPIVSWALVVAISWPLVAARELDWMPWVWWVPSTTPNTAVRSLGTNVWIAQMAQIHLLGLLWFDWLCGRFESDAEGFRRQIVLPLMIAAVFAAGLAVYQGVVDLQALSVGLWPTLGRASGSLADANASGALSALWVAVPVLLALTAKTRAQAAALAMASGVLLAAVWFSGSRTAALGALIGAAGMAHALLIRPGGARRLAIALVVLACLGGLARFAFRGAAVGPLGRMQAMWQEFSVSPVREAGRELWVRNGFGTAAVEMIQDAPLAGVGVGTFNLIVTAYGARTADNAQNWFRHHLAELGIVGCVGLLWWSVLLVALLVRRPAAGQRQRAIVVTYVIVGFGLVSMVGMPSQSVAVTLTAWTFIFWRLSLSEPDTQPADAHTRTRARWPYVAALAIAIVHAGLTIYDGLTDMRPPQRARRFDYGYRYGFFDPFEGDAGETQTSRRAIVVPPAPTPWLKLRVWVDHPDANERPVLVRVSIDGERIIDRRFSRGVPLTRTVRVPGDDQRFVLETSVDRTWAADQARRPDAGLNLSWEFVREP